MKNGKLDKFELYEESVQNPEHEVKLLQRAYRHARNRQPRILREDFCGTASLCCEWVRRVGDGRAIGVDLDRATLEYGRAQHVSRLGKRADRVDLLEANVLDAPTDQGRIDATRAEVGEMCAEFPIYQDLANG